MLDDEKVSVTGTLLINDIIIFTTVLSDKTNYFVKLVIALIPL